MNPKRVALMAVPLPVELVTVSVSAADVVSAGDEESATCTLKIKVPNWLVVPESDPVDCTAIPLGSAPEARVQL